MYGKIQRKNRMKIITNSQFKQKQINHPEKFYQINRFIGFGVKFFVNFGVDSEFVSFLMTLTNLID